jgi:opacity protein-like surface antigen
LKKTTSVIVLASGLTLAGAAVAAAQTAAAKAYVDLNIAGQTQSNTVVTTSTFSLYGETGGTSFSQTVGKGLVFDGGAGYFVRKNFTVGVALSMFTRSPAAAVSVTTPDPIAFNSFTVVSASPKLKQTELGTHIRLAYLVPLNDKAQIAIVAGPSIVRLSKEIATGNVVNGAAQIAVETQTGTGFGAHGGLDFTYLFTPRLGGGIFVRYLRADVDLPAASGVKVGGFQGGLGLRVRF